MDTKPDQELTRIDRMVFVERPRCPSCGGTDVKTTRSVSNGDGTRTQHKRCRDCSTPYEVVWE